MPRPEAGLRLASGERGAKREGRAADGRSQPVNRSEIARIMEFDGKGSHVEPPNANSVRRV